jgi:hypothetical protein
MAYNVVEDWWVSCKEPASIHGVHVEAIINILCDDLGLLKKSTRWVPKLLNEVEK